MHTTEILYKFKTRGQASFHEEMLLTENKESRIQRFVYFSVDV